MNHQRMYLSLFEKNAFYHGFLSMIKFQRRTAEEKNCLYPVEMALSKNYVQ